MKKAGLGGRLGSIALSLAVLLKEHNETDQAQKMILII